MPRSARRRFRCWCARARGCRRSASAAASRPLDGAALRALHDKERLTDDADADLADGISVGVDLAGLGPNNFVGYRAKRHTGVIDVEKRDGHAVADFWEPIAARADKSLILDPDEFYILASKEAVQVPPDYAAEMVPFDPLVGEFRVHYAGFFDPGFGYAGAGGKGARAVLEVRSREVPFILEHGQIVGRLVYEKHDGEAHDALRHGHRLELPGAGPEALEALQGLNVRKRARRRLTCSLNHKKLKRSSAFDSVEWSVKQSVRWRRGRSIGP